MRIPAFARRPPRASVGNGNLPVSVFTGAFLVALEGGNMDAAGIATDIGFLGSLGEIWTEASSECVDRG